MSEPKQRRHRGRPKWGKYEHLREACLADYIRGIQPRVLVESYGVPIECVRDWSRFGEWPRQRAGYVDAVTAGVGPALAQHSIAMAVSNLCEASKRQVADINLARAKLMEYIASAQLEPPPDLAAAVRALTQLQAAERAAISGVPSTGPGGGVNADVAADVASMDPGDRRKSYRAAIDGPVQDQRQ